MDTTRHLSAVKSLIAIGSILILGACGGEEAIGTSTQQLTGENSSDSSSETDIIAVDDEGTHYLFETASDGRFNIALPTGHTYELYISENGTSGLEQASKMVFPRADGSIDHKVRVNGAMDPFDLGEVSLADTLDAASYQVELVSEESQGEEDNIEGSDEAMECDEGPAGLFCVHDGLHPGCTGLSIAAEARNNGSHAGQPAGDDGVQIAREARQAAEHDAEQAEAADEYIPEGDGQGSIDDERPIALPQINPPFEFPGCDG